MCSVHRILAPTDMSDLANGAMNYAFDLARLYGSEPHVLHVVSSPRSVRADMDSFDNTIPPARPNMPLETVISERTAWLREYVREAFGDFTLKPVISVCVGTPAAEIIRYAKQASINLIVIGTHARGVVKRMFLGSTSKFVLEHVVCPVLMVPIAAISGNGTSMQ